MRKSNVISVGFYFHFAMSQRQVRKNNIWQVTFSRKKKQTQKLQTRLSKISILNNFNYFFLGTRNMQDKLIDRLDKVIDVSQKGMNTIGGTMGDMRDIMREKNSQSK